MVLGPLTGVAGLTSPARFTGRAGFAARAWFGVLLRRAGRVGILRARAVAVLAWIVWLAGA
jgi:hypothetical protein